MHGSAMTHLTLDMLKQLPVDEPSLDEQRRMADFLDAETARIDALAKSRRSQISFLENLNSPASASICPQVTLVAPSTLTSTCS